LPFVDDHNAAESSTLIVGHQGPCHTSVITLEYAMKSLSLLFVPAFLVLACTEPTKSAVVPPAAPPAPVAPPPPAPTVVAAKSPADEANEIFGLRCVTCHGANGLGDGVASAALVPKPRAFSDKDWQKSVNDEHLTKVILAGGAAVGKSAMMPGNPDLADKPAVIAALVAKVRSYGK
jgi:mono/diheme cytochrome c family protein